MTLFSCWPIELFLYIQFLGDRQPILIETSNHSNESLFFNILRNKTNVFHEFGILSAFQASLQPVNQLSLENQKRLGEFKSHSYILKKKRLVTRRDWEVFFLFDTFYNVSLIHYITGGKPRPLKGPPSHMLKNTFIGRNSDSIGRNNLL